MERLQSMSLEDYALGGENYKDSFSYWIETETRSLGDVGGIGGGGSFKHGIYGMSRRKEFSGNKRMSDDRYAWTIKYGRDAMTVFQNIKDILLQVAHAAQDNNWDAIDILDFYAPVKWKWAFLYSSQNLIPVYKREALEIAANHLGYGEKNNSYPVLYRYIREQKMEEESPSLLGDKVWSIYLEHKPCNYYIIGSKYGEHKDLDVFPEMLSRNVISTGFASAFDLDDLVGKSQKDIVNFLKEKNEDSNSYSCLKYFLNIKPGDKIAVKADGSPKGDKGFLSIVGIAEAKEADDYYGYDPEGLGHTITVDWLQAPVYKEFSLGGYGRTIHKLNDQDVINEIFNTNYDIVPIKNPGLANKSTMNNTALNQILYGPPGTGKTYNAINYALAIIDGVNPKDIEAKYRGNRKEAVDRFNQLKREGQVEFVTFHQNYAYEDFVQGIKPGLDGNALSFERKDGVFKRISDRAKINYLNSKKEKLPPEISFEDIFSSRFESLYEGEVNEIAIPMKRSSFYINDIGDRSIHFRKEKGESRHSLSISTLKHMFANGENNLIRGGLQPYYEPLLQELFHQKEILETNYKPIQRDTKKNYVLVIDEINRANISRVMGELITLLEKDKRLDEDNEIVVTLPSGENFVVPPNLYILGTMNTADKSIALLDIALRRRFNFVPFYPDKELIDDEKLKTIFSSLNEYIKDDKGIDFTIGHSYFMGRKFEDLESIMNDNVIPLLTEYYMNDMDEVKRILEHSKVAVTDQLGYLTYAGYDG